MASTCLDASFALAIVFNEPHWETARRWWEQGVDQATEFVVPAVFYPEVTSAVRRRVYARLISEAEANRVLAEALAWPVRTHEEDSITFQHRAYALATRFNHPRAYDAQYLAVAEALGCELWTADERLYNSVHSQLPWVRWIGAAV